MDIELKELEWSIIIDDDGMRVVDHVGNIIVRGKSLRDMIHNLEDIIEQSKEH